jgi:NADPH-dependent 2,4-dienoyl-CoA reductase/sulfur reductase-like enzyme
MELSPEEIQQKVEKYAQAARRAREAGFDAVEFHGAHQHPLLAQFLSAHMNRRSDAYGGSPRNRARFAQEVIRRSKEEAGEDFPIIFRLSADEHVEDGMTLEEAKVIAQLLVEAGADALHISAGIMSSLEWCVPPSLLPVGVNVYLAAEIKKVVSVPVIAVGRITSPRFAESLLQQGKVDLIAIGRPLLADPDWARKGLEGREREIRVCLGCNSCYDNVRPIGLWCLLNPELGRRKEFQEESIKTLNPRRVVVVGAGPAGIEAARVAAQKGHQVTLWEESEALGGAWSWNLKSWIAQRIRALREAGVTIELGKKLTPASIEELKPEVVLATERATPLLPDIPGIRQANVFTADEVLAGRVELQGRAAILGGGSQGCQVAEFLGKRGVAVIIIERGEVIGQDIGILHQPFILSRLAAQGAQMFTGLEVVSIKGKKLICVDARREHRTFEVDNVVVALGYKTDCELLSSLEGKGIELHSLPFCGSPRYALEAAHAGSAAACRIGRGQPDRLPPPAPPGQPRLSG